MLSIFNLCGRSVKGKFIGRYFSGNQAKFFLTGKCFPLTNFSNGKQTQKSLESGFPKTTFRKTNTTLVA
jgi:hypothetical protein